MATVFDDAALTFGGGFGAPVVAPVAGVVGDNVGPGDGWAGLPDGLSKAKFGVLIGVWEKAKFDGVAPETPRPPINESTRYGFEGPVVFRCEESGAAVGAEEGWAPGLPGALECAPEFGFQFQNAEKALANGEFANPGSPRNPVEAESEPGY